MSQESILVLEDNVKLREQTCRLLGEAGYIVESATSGAEALAVAHRVSFDLLLCDVQLPDMNGIAAFRQLRGLDPALAGVAMTGYSNWQLAMDAVRAGFTGFLVKPFTAEEMLSAIASALDQEKLRRENLRLRALVPLYELSRMFMGTSELSQALDQIVTTAREETRAEVVSLMLLEQDGQSLSIAAASGLSREIVESQKMALGSGIAGWVAAHGEPLMIAEGMPLDEEVRSAMGKPEVLSALSLPLRTRGEIIGVLNLSRLRGGEPFTPVDLELAAVLAGQAAIAIDKARLIEDLRSLSETSQRLASALDLDEAASIIVAATAHAAHAQRGALWLVEEVSDQLALYKPFNFERDELHKLAQPPRTLLTGTEQFTLRGNRGILWLPIQRAEKKFGLIELHLPGAVPPRPDRLGILRTLAHTAAAVIESHRLRAREAIAFRELSDALRSDQNLHQVLERVLNQMVEACDARGGSVFLLVENASRLEALVSLGTPAPTHLAQQIIRDNQPLLLARFNETGAKGIHSIIGAPLTIGSHVEGAVVLHHRNAGAFAARHLNLLTVLSNSAALLVRNAQLYARSEEAAITEERTRIAGEIHDGVAQDLSFLMLKVEIMRKLLERGENDQLEKEFEEMRAALQNDVREVRRTIFALRPVDLETLGLLPALEKFTKEFGNANDLKVHFKHKADISDLSPKLQTALFRLIQESLNNIRKHARATSAWIELELTEEWASLLVRDNGRGFDPAQALDAARQRGSVGLIQMRERAERAGGSFHLESTPGKGTTTRVKLPIK
jgi:signal transduction histidine kinase/CheY-like chemotaxis protein